jgi:hypothetical protein
MGRVCNMHKDKKNGYMILAGRPEVKGTLGRRRRRCEDNIKMALRHIERHGMDWIDLAQDRDRWRSLVNTVLNFPVP